MLHRGLFILGSGLAVLLGAGSLQAAVITQTFFLNQSNALTDNVSYGEVNVTANSTTGTVKFDVTAPYAYSGSAAPTYGFSLFSLNTNNLKLGTDFTVVPPDDWSVKEGAFNISGFGRYDLQFNAKKGTDNLSSLSFAMALTDPSKATIANFVNLDGPDPNKPPQYFFAGHIQGFGSTGGNTSHFVAGSVPEPSTIVLWSAVGVGGLFFARRFRKK
jgi:hypothetical protein